MIKRTIIFILSVVFVFYHSHKATAQLSGGNISIGEKGIVYIHGIHDFSEGSGFIAPGMITTTKVGAKGYLAFAEGSSWTGATTERFVDGYVKTLHDKPFIFPIGEGIIYRPVAISGGYGTAAAYFKDDPTATIKAERTQSIDRLSTEEYWIVEGQQFSKLSFFWGKESNVASITDGQLDRLTILGYKKGEWHSIASKVQEAIPTWVVQQTQMTDKTSSFEKGIITTLDPIVPGDYKYFTLGSINSEENTEIANNGQPSGIMEQEGLLPVQSSAPSILEFSPSFEIAPNPAQSYFTVKCQVNKGEKYRLVIVDGLSKVHHQQSFRGEEGIMTFDMNSTTWHAGLYYLIIESDSYSDAVQLIIAK